MPLRLLLVLALLGAPAMADEKPPVVLELFTSQGCSSCPPADALLAKLHRQQSVNGADVIVMSEHVDYWNRLGWFDPFSSEQFSKRQSWYSKNWPTRMYTPQMVVDGNRQALGNDPVDVGQTIRRAAKAEKASVMFDAQRNDSRLEVRVEIADLPADQGPIIEVLAAVLEDDLARDVTRGENKGRHLRHVGVVRKLEPIGRFDPDDPGPFLLEGALELDAEWNAENLRAAAIVQDRASRRIIGAAVLPID